MNGFIAKVFGVLLSILSLLVLFGSVFVLTSGETLRNPINGEPTFAWVAVLVFFLIYVVIVGALSVAIHTRELAEQQVDLLKQIQFQLNQNNVVEGSSSEAGRKEPLI